MFFLSFQLKTNFCSMQYTGMFHTELSWEVSDEALLQHSKLVGTYIS